LEIRNLPPRPIIREQNINRSPDCRVRTCGVSAGRLLREVLAHRGQVRALYPRSGVASDAAGREGYALSSKARGPSFYRLSPADVVLVAAVLTLSVASLLWAGGRGSEHPVTRARVIREDAVLREFDLGTDGEYELEDVGMRVEVRDGRIRVTDSDCPHRICVRSGWAGSVGGVIACVPNRVIVEVVSEGEEPFLDAIVQ
jgi:hypothetical protein